MGVPAAVEEAWGGAGTVAAAWATVGAAAGRAEECKSESGSERV